ncbi:MAG: pyridoxal-dependent decarboxylase [Ruminococcaceae bacterium]|nr:pyridoxal-dependent decarboxylase [Oscillospiraceae bacterium]
MKIDKNTLLLIKKEYGDAFYLLDSKQFAENFTELKNAFKSIYPNFNIAYSYKTNYTPKLCKVIKDLGGYAEVVSEMELELALKVGNPPNKIIWNGPIKNNCAMAEFLLSGGTVNIDSIDEAGEIQKIALHHPQTTLNVGIRCNYDVNDGVISRFGFDVGAEDFRNALNIIASTENIKLKNFHCHFAKRQIDFWPDRAQGMLNILQDFKITPDRIDIGGGLFGKMPDSLKAQFTNEIPFYEDYAKAAAGLFADFFKNDEKKPELIIEPGSALVGDCMKFVATVKTIKNIRGKYFATVLGSQKNISMSGVNPPIEVINLSNEGNNYENLDIVGFTCIEGDVLYHNYNGTLATEDMVVIGNCGSYSIVMKPPFILPNFPVLDISNGEIELIKKKETFEDLFHTFVF